jgi:hypothetical protein
MTGYRYLELALAFAHARGFAGAASEEIQASTPDLRMPQDLDFIDARRAQKKRALHSDAVRSDAPHRKTPVGSTPIDSEDHALEDLDSLLFAFHNQAMNTHGVTSGELGDVGIRLVHVERSHQIGHGVASFAFSEIPPAGSAAHCIRSSPKMGPALG